VKRLLFGFVGEFGHVVAGFHRGESFLALVCKDRPAIGTAFDVAALLQFLPNVERNVGSRLPFVVVVAESHDSVSELVDGGLHVGTVSCWGTIS
jgi:hypothetical protein